MRGISEGIYQAAARSYWLSPRLVGRIGGLRRARDELSLGYLLDLMEEVQADVAALDRTAPELPSIGVSGEIRVPAERRQEFLHDLQIDAAGPVHPLRRRRGGRLQARRGLLPERRQTMSEPMTCRARLAAPVEAVRHALTDPAELRVWLAEHAEVELPQRYAFWGRYTPEGDAPHQRLLHVDERHAALRLAARRGGDHHRVRA